MQEPQITLGGRLLALGVGFLIFLGMAEVALRIVNPHWDEFYSARFIQAVNDPDYGRFAMGRPGFDGHFAQNNGDFRTRIRINQSGLRNDEPIEAADGRIWVVGDSMAFGWGVEREETYTARFAEFSGKPVYSVASPGTDLCGYQGLLGRMPKDLTPTGVILGLIVENDIRDYDCRAEAERLKNAPPQSKETSYSLLSVKLWFTGHSALYNFMAVSLKRVHVVNELLIKVGLLKKGHAYRRILKEADLKKDVAKTARELAALRAMLPPDLPFVVLVAPARFEILHDDPFYRQLRLALLDALKNLNIQVVDPLNALKEAGFEPTHFKHDGHWSPLGHEIAAREIARWAEGRM